MPKAQPGGPITLPPLSSVINAALSGQVGTYQFISPLDLLFHILNWKSSNVITVGGRCDQGRGEKLRRNLEKAWVGLCSLSISWWWWWWYVQYLHFHFHCCWCTISYTSVRVNVDLMCFPSIRADHTVWYPDHKFLHLLFFLFCHIFWMLMPIFSSGSPRGQLTNWSLSKII